MLTTLGAIAFIAIVVAQFLAVIFVSHAGAEAGSLADSSAKRR